MIFYLGSVCWHENSPNKKNYMKLKCNEMKILKNIIIYLDNKKIR